GVGLLVAAWDAFAGERHLPEPRLCLRVALLGRLAVPARRAREVLRDADPFGQHRPEQALGARVPLPRRLAQEAARALDVALRPLAREAQERQVRARRREALVGGVLEQARGRDRRARDA